MNQIDAVGVALCGGTPTLVVLPSTQAWMDAAPQLAANGQVTVLADAAFIATAIRPAAYFTRCASARADGTVPPHALVFTDQFVDAPEASIPSGEGQDTHYLSAIELVAASNHGIGLLVWQGEQMQALTAAHGNARIVDALQVYYRQCDALGEQWLMRKRQGLREHAMRCASAVRRIRRYESALMQHLDGDALPADAALLLQDLCALRAGVLRSRESVGP